MEDILILHAAYRDVLEQLGYQQLMLSMDVFLAVRVHDIQWNSITHMWPNFLGGLIKAPWSLEMYE